MKNKNTVNIKGEQKFYGTTQIVAGNLYTNDRQEEKQATYEVEPLWRSPITMGILTWIGVIPLIFDVLPIMKIVNSFTNGETLEVGYMIFFLVLLLISMFVFSLRSITKKQTRHPLAFNLAINGLGKKITIEKIRAKCPICKGKMKYYNKPIETNETLYSDGKIKTEVTKKTPALECKRNREHWWEVDVAENIEV